MNTTFGHHHLPKSAKSAALETLLPALFHAASTLSAPSGHLPLEGKAVCRGYRFPPPASAPSGHLLPKEGGSIHASPFPWKGLPSAARRGWLPFLRRSGALVYRLLETIPLALFHTASTLSAPSGHLPLEGKADDTGIPSSNMRRCRHRNP